jgi:hypothetical protein
MIIPLSGYIVVTGVGAAIVSEFAATPEAGPTPGRIIYSNPGAIAWDICTCDGMFAQTITRKNPTEVYPVDSSNLPNKGGCADRSFMWNVTCVILRCVPGLTQVNGKIHFPTDTSLLNSSRVQNGDEYAMRRAITCTLQSYKTERPQVITDYRVGGSDFVGPEGNCGGVLITYSFQLV